MQFSLEHSMACCLSIVKQQVNADDDEREASLEPPHLIPAPLKRAVQIRILWVEVDDGEPTQEFSSGLVRVSIPAKVNATKQSNDLDHRPQVTHHRAEARL